MEEIRINLGSRGQTLVNFGSRSYVIQRAGVLVAVYVLTDDYVDLIYSDGEIVRCLAARKGE